MDSRGVSDVVAFVLVFSLIAATTGVVYAVGFTGLESARDAERVDNAERAFEVLGDNVADVYREGAPSRKTEIKLADADLSFGATTTMNVSVEGDTAAGNQVYYEANLRPVVFSAGGTDIVYEGGAVVREADGYARMVRAPPFLLEDRRVVLSYVVTTVAGSSGVSGDATVLVRAVRTGQSTLVHDDATPRVTLRIETTTPRAAMWERYVNEQASWTGSDWQDGDETPCATTDLGDGRSEVTCTVEADSFYLTSTGIAVGITA